MRTEGPDPAEAAHEGFYEALLEDDAVALYEQAPCGYLSTAPDGTIIKANRTFLALTGYDAQDLIGRRTFSELLPAGGRIYYETHYAPLLQMHGTARGIALEIVRTDGGRVPVLVNSVLEQDPQGQPLVIRTAVFDATDRREYERELLRAKARAEASEQRAFELARTLQRTLLPPSPPRIEGLEVSAAYRPAGDGSEVGGDFYDVFEISPTDVVIAMGDVSGKGVQAAAVTALARHTIRAAALRLARPSEVLSVLNDALRHDDTDRFCTVALVHLCHEDDGSWKATVASGGHPLPLLVRDGAEPQPVGRFGMLLGLFESPSLHDVEVNLEPGHSLVLFTDGVTEGRRDGELFGEERLAASLSTHRHPADALAQALVDDVMRFQGGNPRDDMAVLSIHVPSSPAG